MNDFVEATTRMMQAMFIAQAIIFVSTLMVGFVFAYLGYRLFCKGIFESAGDLKADWGNRHVMLKRAAPGVVS